MQTLGYRFRPWNSAKAIADGPSILSYVRETAREARIDERVRFGHRVQRAVVGRRALDDLRRGLRADHVRLPLRVRRLLPLRRGLPARVRRGSTRFEGQLVHPQFWPRGPRLRGQARRGHRQRRDGGDARARADRQGRARDHAPALAHLHPLDPLDGRDRQPAAAGAGLAPRVRRHPLEERRGGDRDLPAQPAPAAVHEEGPARRRGACAAGGLRRRHPLQPALRAVGSAAVPGARRRPVQGDQRGQGVGGHGRDPALHPGGVRLASGQELAGRHHRHRHRAEPARAGRHRAGRRRRAGRRCRSGWPTRA